MIYGPEPEAPVAEPACSNRSSPGEPVAALQHYNRLVAPELRGGSPAPVASAPGTW